MADSASVSSNTLAHYPHIPNFYLVARGLASDRVEAVRNALMLTPIAYVIVFDVADQQYAKQFGLTVLLVADDDAARSIARAIFDLAVSEQWARSVIIRAQGNPLTAVFPDRETVEAC